MERAMHRRAFLQTGVAALALGSVHHRCPSAQAGPVAAEVTRTLPVEAPSGARHPIVDTHQHLWDLKRFNLPWLSKAPEAINRSFLLDDFRQAAAGLEVVKTVYMEVDVHPAQQVQEAEFAVELCNSNELVAGAVIGGAPHDKNFSTYLKRFKGVDCIKGVRTVLHGERPRGLCLEPVFVDSMKLLGDVGLTFDLCMRPGELHDGAVLAQRAPGTTFILDHCGNIGPRSNTELRPMWCEGIKSAAAQPNVVCKISGVFDKLGDVPVNSDEIAENIDFCLDAFGEDRVVFGGDWPVCLLGGSYRSWVQCLEAVVRNRPPHERRKLFYENAVRIYRLA